MNCAGATLSPAQQIIGGTAITGGTVLQIPYTGSNGGSFNGASLVSTGNSDVTATISGSMLSVGNGVLSFTLTGTPTVSQQAPNGITFDLQPFLDQNPGITGCTSVTVGNVLSASVETRAVMGLLSYKMDMTGNDTNTEGYVLECNTPDGKYSIRVRVPYSVPNGTISLGSPYINVQLRNNQDTSQTMIWNYNAVFSGGSNFAGANVLVVPSQVWGGSTLNEDGIGTTWENASNTLYGGGYWGNIGIYDGTGPEYRRYTWIPLGDENKVSYEVHTMAALESSSPTTPVAPTRLKVYIKIDQVTAL